MQLVGGNATAEPSGLDWTGPDGFTATSDTLSVDLPGVYRLILRNPTSGCVDSARVLVGLDTLAPEVTLDGLDTLDCTTADVELTVPEAQRNERFAYRWEGGAAGAVLSEEARLGVAQGGAYALLVTDTVNGCTQLLATTVEQDTVAPTLQLPPTDTLNCVVETVTGRVDAAGALGRTFGYNWTSATGTINSGATAPVLTVSAAADYTVTVTDPVNGCQSTGIWTVTADYAPPVVTVPTLIETSFCAGMTEDIRIVADTNYVYNWVARNAPILTDAGPRITVNAPGFYDVTVTNPGNGCMESYTVEVREDDLTDYTLQVLQPNCNRATGGVSVLRTDGGTGPFLLSTDGGAVFAPVAGTRVLTPGAYEVVLQDINGCEVSKEVVVEEVFDLAVSLPEELVIRRGDSVQLVVTDNLPAMGSLTVDSVVWSPALGLSCSNCPAPFARPERSQAYTAEVFTSDGCSAVAGVNIIVDERETVYFPTAFSPNGDGRNDRFYPFAEPGRVSEVRDFRVFDRWGSLVYSVERLGVNDAGLGWDGLVGGREAGGGVFVYSALVVFVGGGEVVYAGEVVLLR